MWKDARGREYAQRWVAHDATALASDITKPERARSVDELLQAVAGLGIPNQNVTMADDAGRIAWTIGGTIPKRVGHDGMTPESWADGTHRWDGYLSAAEFPRIVDPPRRPHLDRERTGRRRRDARDDRRRRLRRRHSRAADSRSTDAHRQGHAAATCSASSSRIARCSSSAGASCCWRRSAPDPSGAARAKFTRPGRQALDRPRLAGLGRRIAWSRNSGLTFVRRVMTSLTAPALAVDPAFDYTRLLRGEGPVWQILSRAARCTCSIRSTRRGTTRSWLPSTRRSRSSTEGGKSLGRSHVGRGEQRRDPCIRSRRAIPFFGRYLNMPGDPLPGDVYTPRASTPRTGPSERMVVSPGRETRGHPRTSRPARAAIRSRRITAINTARGSTASRRRSCREPTVTTLTLTPRQ